MDLTPRELEMTTDTDVVGHITREAAAIKAAADARGDSFYFIPTTAHAENGDYANVYEYERSMALNEYSDVHKEERGYRPRGDFGQLTLEEIEARTLAFFPDDAVFEFSDHDVDKHRLDDLTAGINDRIPSSKWQRN
jgi:hypothetical protein